MMITVQERARKRDESKRRILEGETTSMIYEKCSTLTPGLTDTSDGPTQLSGRAVFFDCVTNTFHEEVEVYAAAAEDNPPAGSATRGVSAVGLGLLAVAIDVLW
jgi:hypothetical protein